MSIQRYDLNNCIGCRTCMDICPMDVFRFHAGEGKSIIAYPENCQTCGQCFVNCPGHALSLSGEAYAFPTNSLRAASVLPTNRRVLLPDVAKAHK